MERPDFGHRLAGCGPHRLGGGPAEPHLGRISRHAAVKVLVTGAAGQVGSELVRLGTETFQPIGLSRDDLDITNAAAVAHAIERWQPQAVVNCAAYTAVDRAESDIETAHAVNVEAVAHLATACSNVRAGGGDVSPHHVLDGKNHPPERGGVDTAPQGG
ncbi:MAG: sugar nucleotide-binding protein, partial [Gammaproteobacteria bacterium]|nr:sugar nucleotide-binding protein [Gammaproteobacteria bacterium]